MKGIECCGESHDLYFCPYCGRKLRERSELAEMINHFALLRKRLKTQAAGWKSDKLNKGKSEDYCKSRADSCNESIEKFTRWIKALNEVMNREG